MEDQQKVLVIASAGGHLTQAMCAVSKIKHLYLVTNKNTLENSIFKKTFTIKDTQHNIFIHLLNVFYALYLLLLLRPTAVFSTGGPICLPFALICKLFNKKYVHLDTLSRVTELSNSARFIHKYNLASNLFVQWKSVAEEYNLPYIGKCFDILNENSYQPILLTPSEKLKIFVTVGTNQYAFSRLFDELEKQPLYHSDKIQWIIQNGHSILTKKPPNSIIRDFVTRTEMENYTKEANLVISHCGIGSINLMLAYQKRVLFVPRLAKYNEFSDDHQLQIASEIENNLFTVADDQRPFPEITEEELKKAVFLQEPVDTTNNKVAFDIKAALQ
jgi:UDP-N-acetylglucosamine transferase subunit ALG13